MKTLFKFKSNWHVSFPFSTFWIFLPIFLIMVMSANEVHAQNMCFTPPTSTNMDSNLGIGDLGTTGPFYIKVYVHVIRHTNGTGGQSTAAVDAGMAILDQDYNPHNIFFVWDGCIDYIDDDAWFSTPGVGIYNVNNHYDGIDIYLFDDSAAAGGRANGVGSSSEFWVSGKYWNPPYASLTTSHVMSHEMGHVLFLWHTHHQVESGSCEEYVDGSNCEDCGDFVCDTPSDPYLGFNVDPNSCVWQGSGTDSHGDPYDPDTQLIMAYTDVSCMSYFSEGQGQRARDAIETLEFLQATLLEGPSSGGGCACNSSDIHLYSNTTWDTDQAFNANVYVHAGAQLTITSKVEFGQGKGIIVRRGAKLHVNGGTLTKCPGAPDWRGINVEGNASLNQPSAFGMPSSSQAGIVLITNNSLVEWARTAISTTRYNQGWNGPYWGGLIHCENSTFISNRRVAEFMKYEKSNKSKFINCTMDADGVGYAGVTIWDTDNVTFNYCRFYNMSSQGILTYDAGAIVKNGNDFNGNTRGVQSQATYPFAAYLQIGDNNSEPNYFVDNIVAISSNATSKLDGIKVINNQIFQSIIGVYLTGPSRFRIENNSIGQTFIGVYASETGSLGNNQHNYVNNNFFSGYYGIIARGQNREMQFLCNQFNTNSDFYLSSGSGTIGQIRKFQGHYGGAAGNCFTTPQNWNDITTVGNTDLFYYFTPGEAICKIPYSPGNYQNITAFTEDCSLDGLFPENPDINDYYAVVNEIDQFNSGGGGSESELADLKQQKELILLAVIESFLEDEQIASAISLLDQENTTTSKLIKFGIQMKTDDLNNALTTLNALPVNEGDMGTFKQIQYINIDRMQQGLTYELSSEDFDYLMMVAESDLSVKGYARSLLGLLEGIEFEEDYVIEEGDESGEGGGKKAEITKPVQVEQMTVFPNPAKTEFTITVEGDVSAASIQVVSVLGQIVFQQEVETKGESVIVPVHNWNSGLYIVNLTAEDGALIQSELVVVNR